MHKPVVYLVKRLTRHTPFVALRFLGKPLFQNAQEIMLPLQVAQVLVLHPAVLFGINLPVTKQAHWVF